MVLFILINLHILIIRYCWEKLDVADGFSFGSWLADTTILSIIHEISPILIVFNNLSNKHSCSALIIKTLQACFSLSDSGNNGLTVC